MKPAGSTHRGAERGAARAGLLLRADGSAGMGIGHVMRCLALGAAWQARGGVVELVGVLEGEALARRVEATGLGLTRLGRAHPDAADLGTTLDRLGVLATPGGRRPWLVLDGYHFDPAYERAVRAAGYRVLAIDDTASRPAGEPDILLNQNVHAEQLPYRLGPDTVPLLGPRYVLLRSEFRVPGPARTTPAVARRVLVTLGGGDDGGAALTVVQALGQARVDGLEATVVVGPASPREAELAAAARDSRIPVRLVPDARNMAELMRWAEVAVAAGGTTAWELCALGVPSVIMVLADDQRGTATRLGELGLAVDAGRAAGLTAAELWETVVKLLLDADLRRKMSELGPQLVDGRGIQRVVEAIEGFDSAEGEARRLRQAAPDDAVLLWLWANDPATRANSFSSDAIPWESHQAWYRGKLASGDSRTWILEWRRVPVGQIRYDRVEGQTGRISFSVAPAYRGRGIGTCLLTLSGLLACRELGVSRLEGITFARNRASAGAFLRAGFAQVAERTMDGETRLVFERRCAGEAG